MKTIVKIEIAILVLVVLVAAGMILLSEGALYLFVEPEIMARTPEPIPTETAAEPAVQEETAPAQTVPPVSQPTEESREITATRYYVYDVRKEAYLRTLGDVHEKLYPASITKLLSSLVVLEHMDPADTVKVGDALSLVREDSTTAGLMEGDILTVEQLISAMMLPSGNDAAQVAAVATGRAIGGQELDCWQAVSVFVEKMNDKAQELGMENSHFANPDGMPDDNHYTTMNDLVILSQAVLQNQTILKYTSKSYDAVQLPDRTLEWRNTNLLLHESLDTYIPNTIGLKTGFTNAAGNCLVSAFFKEDRLWLIGVFGCPAFTMDRYLDTVEIYNSL